MFSMFIETPPPSEPVTGIYQEKLAFGPFGLAAGETTPTTPPTGFSEVLWLQVLQSAADKYKNLRLVCDGTLHVLGVQQGFPFDDTTAPLVVELIPAPYVMRELQRLCSANQAETPRSIVYHGV